VAKSALEAVQLGFAAAADDILFNAHELLYVAMRRARALAEAGWRAGAAKSGGERGRSQRHRHLRNDAGQHGGGRLHLGARLPGGQGRGHRAVRRRGRHRLEGERAVDPRRRARAVRRTAEDRETQQRIAHMLETGKPLRN
jgi:3-hydroxyacyl-CoA dehydrogenase